MKSSKQRNDMMNRFAFAVATLVVLGTALCRAQGWTCRMSLGGMMPVERSFASLEVRKQVAPRYALSMAGEVSMTESNISPKLAVGLGACLNLELGFGWGHKWQKEGCNDHNFHTYTVGLVWARPISRHWTIFAGPSMFWRSYQGHIGFHRGSVRVCSGVAFNLNIPPDKAKQRRRLSENKIYDYGH